MKNILSIVFVLILVVTLFLLLFYRGEESNPLIAGKEQPTKPSATDSGWTVLGYPPIEKMMLLSGHEFSMSLGTDSEDNLVHINWADKQMIRKLKAYIDSIKIKKINKKNYITKSYETIYVHADWYYHTKDKKRHNCGMTIIDQYVLIGEQVYETESPFAPAAKILFDELKIIEQKIQDGIEEEDTEWSEWLGVD